MVKSKADAKLKENKKISRNGSDFHFSRYMICCKWWNNRPVLFLARNVDGMSEKSNAMVNKGFSNQNTCFSY